MFKNKSASSHQFSMVPRADIPRSSFKMQKTLKTTFDSGWLVPILCEEVLPGDTFNVRMTSFCRLATPIFPIMDNLHLESFFFFVPNRLVWSNWHKFMGEQENPGDSISYVIPQAVSPVGGYLVGSLQDHFGLPTVGQVSPGASVSHSTLPLRAYNLIYNQWFRDENLIGSAKIDKHDGPDFVADYQMRRRGKRHDYFTSCLPWVQKGQSVQLPLGSTAPVIPDTPGSIPTFDSPARALYMEAGTNDIIATGGNAATAHSLGWNNPALKVDLSTATAATINQIRQAFQVQRMYEKDARGGTRYTEIIQSHFNVVSPDARLQRPEYLGGGSVPVNVNPIAQTSSTDTEPTPQGNLAAMGTAHMNRVGFTKSFTEHGHIIGLVSVRADLNYQQGLNRMWFRQTRMDFFWPALAHLGEQAVLNKEIYAQGTAADTAVFGYQERYAEYRYKPSLVTGQMRSNHATSLDTWHLSQDFAALPTLGPSFIVEDPPVARVIAVPSEPHFIFDSFISLRCARPMPVYGVPGMIDHF